MIDSPGLLDTNVFIHAHTHDNVSEECRAFLAALEAGSVRAVLEPVILHELSYALPHYLKQMTREEIAEYLLMILSWDGVLGSKETLIDTVERWRRTPRLSFVDAYLAARSSEESRPVYSKNERELRAQGVTVPRTLPRY